MVFIEQDEKAVSFCDFRYDLIWFIKLILCFPANPDNDF